MLVCHACGNVGCFEPIDFIRFACCTCGNIVEVPEPLRGDEHALEGGKDVSP
ncbi:hypothetical protein [Geoglobus acetivorans]|uniref:hypothetical protein n=1 Tax=Geoglobus acetivorans TaxID=565033 RepID=UPI00130E16D3